MLSNALLTLLHTDAGFFFPLPVAVLLRLNNELQNFLIFECVVILVVTLNLSFPSTGLLLLSLIFKLDSFLMP